VMISCFSAFRATKLDASNGGALPGVLLVMTVVVVGCWWLCLVCHCCFVYGDYIVLSDGATVHASPYSDDGVLQELRVGSLKIHSSRSCAVLQALRL
jgi:glycerol-3-phosphate acyltransferase PlsY